MLLEAVVASVIFMLVFAMAVDSLISLGSLRSDGNLPAVEADTKACVDEFVSNPYPAGEYVRKYVWGKVTVNIAPYMGCEEILEVRFDTDAEKSRRRIRYTTLKAAYP